MREIVSSAPVFFGAPVDVPNSPCAFAPCPVALGGWQSLSGSARILRLDCPTTTDRLSVGSLPGVAGALRERSQASPGPALGLAALGCAPPLIVLQGATGKPGIS